MDLSSVRYVETNLSFAAGRMSAGRMLYDFLVG